MTESQVTAITPRRRSSRVWVIFVAVGIAATIPILPLSLIFGEGTDLLPHVEQAVQNGKNWFNQMQGNLVDQKQQLAKPIATTPVDTSPKDKLKILAAAAEDLNKKIEAAPNDPSLQNRLGLIYLSIGDTERACRLFGSAVELSRNGINRLSEKMKAANALNRTKEASEALLEASQLNVELSAAHSNLARVYERLGDHQKVMAELDQLNREGVLFDRLIESGGTPTASASNRMRPEIAKQLAKAEAFVQARQYPMAVAEYRKLVSMDPTMAMAHHRLGTMLAMCNEPLEAMDELEKAAQLNSNSASIYNDLGMAYQTNGLQPQAVAAFERSLALDPKNVDAAINLSNILAGSGRLDDAGRVLAVAAKQQPNSATVHNNLGSILSLQGHHPQAQYEFQRAISLSPRMSSAHYGLGLTLMERHSYVSAIRSFKTALALNPNMIQAQNKIEEASRRAGMASGSAQAMN